MKKKTKNVNIFTSITKELYEKMRLKSYKEKISLSEIHRQALNLFFNKEIGERNK